MPILYPFFIHHHESDESSISLSGIPGSFSICYDPYLKLTWLSKYFYGKHNYKTVRRFALYLNNKGLALEKAKTIYNNSRKLRKYDTFYCTANNESWRTPVPNFIGRCDSQLNHHNQEILGFIAGYLSATTDLTPFLNESETEEIIKKAEYYMHREIVSFDYNSKSVQEKEQLTKNLFDNDRHATFLNYFINYPNYWLSIDITSIKEYEDLYCYFGLFMQHYIEKFNHSSDGCFEKWYNSLTDERRESYNKSHNQDFVSMFIKGRQLGMELANKERRKQLKTGIPEDKVVLNKTKDEEMVKKLAVKLRHYRN